MTTPPPLSAHSPHPPALLTFDVFGTVLDWRRGMSESLERRGFSLGDAFDRVVDRQGEIEQRHFELYAKITADSLVDVLAVDRADADEIGAEVGTWPPYADSPAAMRRLLAKVPCMAMTNSDRICRAAVEKSLGAPLTHWLSAEDTRVYKPNLGFWEMARTLLGIPFSKAWWHVSAYADYDLAAANQLGLTTVFIERGHSRPGEADIRLPDLGALADLVGRLP